MNTITGENKNIKILNNLYSRQIGTYGKEAMDYLMKLNVLILGQRGNGIEISKNTVLSGVNQVTIYDPTLVSIQDLGSNFYLEEKDINNRRDESILKKLQELNPFTHVEVLQYKEGNEESLEDYLSKLDIKYNVIVQTEFISEEKINKLSNYCHSNGIKFIYGVVFGLSAFIFDDFGENFKIFDEDGIEPKKYHCKSITSDEKALMIIEEDKGRFCEEDKIRFKGVEGMDELNKLGEIKVLKIIENENKKKEYILDLDTRNFGKYKAGGLVYKPKEPIEKNFKSFEENCKIPFERKSKDEYFNSSEEGEEYLYNDRYNLSVILALGKYLNDNKILPKLNDNEEAQKITNIAKNLFNQMKKHDEEEKIIYEEYNEEEIKQFNEKEVTDIIKISKAEISPMCSLIGGIISQEIIKATGKYEPIEQWKFYNFSFIKKVDEEKKEEEKEKTETEIEGRYEEQIAIFGKDFQEKLENLQLFIIGSGAIGCEVLKNFAMMGVSTKSGKQSIITDCDKIEMSNLNRQFLFRKKDIGEFKSLTACNAIKKMNPKFNCFSSTKKVEKKTEDVFNEQFWTSKDFIICGLDNVKARNYVNKICHKNNKSFLDAGTNGTKGRVTVVIPTVTIPMELSEPKKKRDIPMCTLKYFPSQIEDCIEWSQGNFVYLFINSITLFKDFINNSIEDYLKKLNEKANSDFIDIVKNIEIFMNLLNQENDQKRLEKIIYKSLEHFHDYYNIKIKDLLKFHPIDQKTEDGKPFWNAIKRPPKPIEEIDIKNDMTKLFIISFANILSNCLGLKKIEINDEMIYKIISEFKKKTLNRKNDKIVFEYDDEEEEFNSYKKEAIEELKSFKEIIKNNINIYEKVEEVKEFDKDGLDNYHIEFIQSSSNLRANNYYIEPADYNKTLMIAGSIIQALPTTTAAVSGYLALQLMALINSQDIEKEIQNANMDLSCNMLFNYSPSKYVPKPKPESIKINKSMTSQEFLDFCKNEHKFDVYSYYIGDKNCYTRKLFKEFEKKKDRYKKYIQQLNSKIEDNYNCNLPEDKKKKEFVIQIYANKIISNESGDSIESEETDDELPLVEYKPYNN